MTDTTEDLCPVRPVRAESHPETDGVTDRRDRVDEISVRAATGTKSWTGRTPSTWRRSSTANDPHRTHTRIARPACLPMRAARQTSGNGARRQGCDQGRGNNQTLVAA